jgi:hypothetical protein
MKDKYVTSKCGVQCYLTIFLYIIDKRNKTKFFLLILLLFVM